MRWRRDRTTGDRSRVDVRHGLADNVVEAVSANDAPRAWAATWDLIAANDYSAESRALAMLQPLIAAAYHPTSPRDQTNHAEGPTDAGTDTCTDLAPTARALTAWQRAELALAIVETIEQSREPQRQRTLSSREVRKHHEAEQTRRFRQSLANAGVRPGEGLPAWMLYMSRRKKKNWD